MAGRVDVDAMLAEMTPEEFDEWQLSDKIDGTVGGIGRLTKTLAEVGSSLCALSEAGHQLEPWQFIPGAEPPETDETENESNQLKANLQGWSAVV